LAEVEPEVEAEPLYLPWYTYLQWVFQQLSSHIHTVFSILFLVSLGFQLFYMVRDIVRAVRGFM